MKIAIFGTGYVGLVTGVCFSNVGHQVTCVDGNKQRIDNLKKGVCPIVEKNLPARLEAGIESGNLKFTTNSKRAIEENDVIFIAVEVSTNDRDQVYDVSPIFKIVNKIEEFANSQKIVVQKSTVPAGTGDLMQVIFEIAEFNHLVVSNPDFLREGDAVVDFEFPDRVIVGADDKRAKKVLAEIYRPFIKIRESLIFMSRSSAELTKIFTNTMLAMRLSAMNSFAELAEIFGADINEIEEGIGCDSRIGPKFLASGGATFGGSWLSRDVRTLIKMAREHSIDSALFEEILKVNSKQRLRFLLKIFEYFDKSFEGKKIAIWGLSSKAGTDNVEEAAALDIVSTILDEGGKVAVYDSVAMENFQKRIGERKGIVYEVDPYRALKNADALVILTDAGEFRSLDIPKIRKTMKSFVVFDGKNLHDPAEKADQGIDYCCMGRPYQYPAMV